MLENKKILFFGVNFFGYENEIKKGLEKQGAKVYLYDERAIQKSWEKAILKITPKFFYLKTIKYYKKIIYSHKEENIDFIFFWSTDMVFRKIIYMLRISFPNANIINYQSDSILSNKFILKKLNLFDKTVTYDRKDYTCLCEKVKNLQFRPLFFIDNYCSKKEESKAEYKVSFIGTIHSDRYRLILMLQNYLKKNGYKSYFYNYLQAKFMYVYYKITNKDFKYAKYGDFKYIKISSEKISEIYNNSEIIFDAQYPKNTGLTMRTLETLASGKKLITTNKDIVNYNFYNPNNIKVIDREDFELDMEFLEKPYQKIRQQNVDVYQLSEWIKDIFVYDNYNINRFIFK